MSDFNFLSNFKYQNTKLSYTSCPLCGSDNKKLMYPQKYNRLNICNKCGLLYTNPRLTKKDINKLYNFNYFNNSISRCFGYSNYLADEEKIRRTFRRRLKEINKFFPNRGLILDLGCAAGFFIDEARNQNWKTEGVELSTFMADYTRNKFDLNVVNKDIEIFDFPNNKYDLITLWDTIEHLTDPLNMLKKINSSLKNGGMLIFSTPDVESIPAKITGSSWIGFKLSDEHLTYFSRNTIKKICELTGFKIIKWQYQGKYVSPNLFIDRIETYSIYLAKIFKIIHKIFPKEFYINPFDIICVYAKKI